MTFAFPCKQIKRDSQQRDPKSKIFGLWPWWQLKKIGPINRRGKALLGMVRVWTIEEWKDVSNILNWQIYYKSPAECVYPLRSAYYSTSHPSEPISVELAWPGPPPSPAGILAPALVAIFRRAPGSLLKVGRIFAAASFFLSSFPQHSSDEHQAAFRTSPEHRASTHTLTAAPRLCDAPCCCLRARDKLPPRPSPSRCCTFKKGSPIRTARTGPLRFACH